MTKLSPDAIKSGDIILDPEYQRDVVWDDTRCEGLLVSLLSELYPILCLYCLAK